ncbi:MAG: tRNA (adenosine(37)-N6)-threonylcarbamoyltransferase complex dimerization subunit type 1 TsaB [Pseudomonadales bacterium]
MTILALETSAASCQLAIYDGETLRCIEEHDQRHSRVLLAMAERLLETNNKALRELDSIAVCVGPGSFTGLRIGVAVAQGLAYAAGLPVLAVSSLAAIAFEAELATRSCRAGESLRVLATLDARKEQIYCAWFDCDSESVRAIGEAVVCNPGELPEAGVSGAAFTPHNIVIAGSGLQYAADMPGWVQALAVDEFNGASLAQHDTSLSRLAPTARAVAVLASRAFAKGGGIEPVELKPLYLRDKVTD